MKRVKWLDYHHMLIVLSVYMMVSIHERRSQLQLLLHSLHHKHHSLCLSLAAYLMFSCNHVTSFVAINEGVVVFWHCLVILYRSCYSLNGPLTIGLIATLNRTYQRCLLFLLGMHLCWIQDALVGVCGMHCPRGSAMRPTSDALRGWAWMKRRTILCWRLIDRWQPGDKQLVAVASTPFPLSKYTAAVNEKWYR